MAANVNTAPRMSFQRRSLRMTVGSLGSPIGSIEHRYLPRYRSAAGKLEPNEENRGNALLLHVLLVDIARGTVPKLAISRDVSSRRYAAGECHFDPARRIARPHRSRCGAYLATTLILLNCHFIRDDSKIGVPVANSFLCQDTRIPLCAVENPAIRSDIRFRATWTRNILCRFGASQPEPHSRQIKAFE